jgi:hypothetical protein
LFVTLELTGEPAAQATAYGFFQVQSAKDNEGNVLNQVKTPFSMQDPTEQFINIDRNMMFAGTFDRPEDTIKLHLMVDRPADTATELAELEGSLKLMVGGQSKQVILPGALQNRGTPLTDPALEQAGLSVRVRPDAGEADPNVVRVEITGPPSSLSELKLVDAGGGSMETGMSWSSSEGTTSYTMNAEKELPPDAALRLQVMVGQKPLAVPFKFQNAPLPGKEPEQQ